MAGCVFGIVLFRSIVNPRFDNSQSVSASTGHTNDKCWLKYALKSGELKLFSHRSYYDNTQEETSCIESLTQLKDIGVTHLDLDLCLDQSDSALSLVVAHPMEFKHELNYYSPCANTDFDEMIQALEHVYGNDFFISMEPKAAWGNTAQELNDAALTNLPSSIMKVLFDKIEQHDLRGKCAVILEINTEAHDGHEIRLERSLLKNILSYCQLFKGIRLKDDTPFALGEYDMIMPTIEFHPSHPHNFNGEVIARDLWSKSIFWVVDNEQDLVFAAELHPFGIVSNAPRMIVDIVESSSWCDR
jgi:hypothetical protein